MNIKIHIERIRLYTLILIVILLIFRLKNEGKPYPTGDAIEYTIMTEAFNNHFSPDLRAKDFESFKKLYTRNNYWVENDKASVYDDAYKFIVGTNYKPLDDYYAFFVAENGKKYSCHFFAYSLINLPMRWLCAIIGFNPLLIHQFTNALLVLLFCFLFFKYSPFSEIETSVFVLLFLFSTNYWYLSWQHPEIFTVCFSSFGLWMFFGKKYYTGIFFISIAALQNQPLSILIAMLCLVLLFEKGFNLKNIFKIGLSCILIFLPSLFYYYHFGVTNLINYKWPLNFQNVTAIRVFGFFFDLNQGMVLAIPFILFVYIFLCIRKLIFLKSSTAKWDLFIPVIVLIMTIIVSAIIVWNMGQSVVNRYVTYIGGIILVHFFMLAMQIKSKIKRNAILIISVITQITTVFYHNSLSKYDWSTNIPKPLSNWALENYPKLYNPDPIIFIARYNPNAISDLSLSPVYFIKSNGEIAKLLVNKNHIHNLIKLGLSENKIDSIEPHLIFLNDWAYVDINSQLQKSFSVFKIKEMDNRRKINDQIAIIKASPEWYNKILEQAKKENISEEETLEKNAIYILSLHTLPNIKFEDRLNNKILEIKFNKNWLNQIEQKAKKQNISLDSAIYIDAKWMVEQEAKK